MLGLPTETEEDIAGIADLSNKVAKTFYEIPKGERPGNGRVDVVASTSFFVPKPFTPFQWVRQCTDEEFVAKQKFLSAKMKEQINHARLTETATPDTASLDFQNNPILCYLNKRN